MIPRYAPGMRSTPLWIAALLSLGASLALGPASAAAQDDLLVLIVDPGTQRLNQRTLGRAIGRATERTVIRMTDERAQAAQSRLTIAFSGPDRWVLRYESHGQVAWVSDRIRRGGLGSRLAELSSSVVARVDRSPSQQRRRAWDDDILLALHNEIVDPFADLPPAQRREPVSILWSEVVDPFSNRPPRAESTAVWSEVLDPWAGNGRRRP